MGKKSTAFGVIIIVIVAVLVYCIGNYIIKFVDKDSDKQTTQINSVSKDEKRKPASEDVKDDISDDNSDDTAVEDVFEYFKDKTAQDAIAYSDTMREVQMIIKDDGQISYAKDNQDPIVFNSPVETSDEAVMEIDFCDYNNGIFMINVDAAAGSTYYDVRTTADGGNTWSGERVISIAGSARGLYMINRNEALLISTGSPYCTDVIYISNDNGVTWEPVENELLEMEYATIFPLKISDDENVFLQAVMDDDKVSKAVVYKTDGECNIEDFYDIKFQ